MEKIVYKIDSFEDFTGTQRQVIMAAVSQEVRGNAFTATSTDFTGTSIIKEVRLGVSVQSPSDIEVPNEELGKIIAVGKAKKEKSCFGKLFSTDKGFINHKLIDAFLSQEMDYFKQNPGKYIKGYNRDKELFDKNYDLYFAKFPQLTY